MGYPNRWRQRESPIVSSVIEVYNSIKNLFTYSILDKVIHVLSSILSSMWDIGFQEEAVLLLKRQQDKIH